MNHEAKQASQDAEPITAKQKLANNAYRFFAKRGALSSRAKFNKVMRKVKTAAPLAGDERIL